MTVYSLGSAINEFFSRFTVTRDECDRAAAEITGENVEPVQLQGAFSYTVASRESIVQFRAPESLLDTEKTTLAREIYGKIVPSCTSKGMIGSLTIYRIDKAPGITYIEAPSKSLSDTAWQERTVSDLARFFAISWINQLGDDHCSQTSMSTIQTKLDTLQAHLPSRFTALIADLREKVSAIFLPTYHIVLGHGDLCEMNMIVDPDVGGITGIIDWAEAEVLPFGLSLWGLRNLLGWMDSSGWHYHANASRLESLFWDVFYESVGGVSDEQRHAIRIAERVGILLRYGFSWDDGKFERPITEQDSSMRYLDAFLHH